MASGWESWKYADQQAWVENYPKANGTRQSPIKINTKESSPKSFPVIKFVNYNKILNVEMINDGHTARIEYPEDSEKPQISGGPFATGTVYELVNIQFHWGENDAVGAEHVIDNQRHSVEVHVIHYNLKYGSYQEALNHSDGIAIIATFYKANPTQRTEGLQSVTDALSNIIKSGDEVEIQNFQLSALIGGPTQRIFYSYEGSLSTPPCFEAVTWIIYPKALLVTSEQIQPFRALLDDNGEPLVNTFRELQNRNGREIYRGHNIF